MCIDLSQTVLDICKANYESNCGKCPIRSSCVTKQAIRTQEDLDRHVMRINEHAAEVLEEGQTDLFDYL